MDKSAIVILVNIAYSIVYILAWQERYRKNVDKMSLLNDPKYFEYQAYSWMGLCILPIIGTTLIRNYDVFNNWFPISFIVQFIVQFIILICLLVPDHRIPRLIASYIALFFLIFALLNGLFKKDTRPSRIELTTAEINSLSDDVTKFSEDLNRRVKQINDQMQIYVNESRKTEIQLREIEERFKLRQLENDSLVSVIEINEEQARIILKRLNIHPPTIFDRILDGFIGAFIGVFVTLIIGRTPFGKKV